MLGSIARYLFRLWVLFQFHVSLALVSFYALITWSAAMDFSVSYACFLFVSGFTGYHLIRLVNLKHNRAFIREFYRKNAGLLLVLLAVSSICWFYEVKVSAPSMEYRLLLPFAIALLYSPGKFLPYIRLREIGFLKILLVATVWALLITWVPWGSRFITWLWFPPVFFMVIMLIIPFDIRDLSMDPEALRTLPQVFREKTFWIAFLLGMILILYLLSLYSCDRTDALSLTVWATGALLTLLAIKFAPRFSGDYYFPAFWVEGIPVFMAGMYMALSWLTN